MKLTETLALGNRRQLFLVICDKRRYLVGAGADSVGTIVQMEAANAEIGTPVEIPMKHSMGPQLVRSRSFGKERGRGEDLVPHPIPGQELWH